MYTQGLDQKGKTPQQSDSLDTPEQLEAFQQRIDAEEKIEAKERVRNRQLKFKLNSLIILVP